VMSQGEEARFDHCVLITAFPNVGASLTVSSVRDLSTDFLTVP
jgi:hypothetical protein